MILGMKSCFKNESFTKSKKMKYISNRVKFGMCLIDNRNNLGEIPEIPVRRSSFTGTYQGFCLVF